MAAKEVKEKVKSGKSKPMKKTKSAPSKVRTSKKSAEVSATEAATDNDGSPIKKSRAKTAAVKKSKSSGTDPDASGPAHGTETVKKVKLGKPSAKQHRAPTSAPLTAKKNKSVDKNPVGELKSALKIQGAIAPRAATTAAKSSVVKPGAGGGTVAARRISAKTPAVPAARSAAPASAAKLATDKPTVAASTATATRLRTPGKRAGGNARAGQQQAGAGSGDTATQSARSRSNLLTARSHRSSLSSYGHGESTVSPYGDVRTMVCDVSPVPSDVESIDFSNTGRSQALRVGRDTDNPAFGNIAKKQMYKDDSPKAARKSANKITSQADGVGCEPADGTEHQIQRSEDLPTGGATAKNDVLVRIVPDSAKSPASANQKGDLEKKLGSKTGPSQPIRPNDKGTKGRPGAAQPAKQPPQSTNKQQTANTKFVRNSTIIKTTLAVCNTGQRSNSGQKKSGSHDESNKNKDDDTEEKVAECNDLETSNGTLKLDQNMLDNPEIEMMGAPNIRIPADEECFKAYTVLNNRGFKISLHTIRKALLTPSEYRMLLSGPRNGVAVLPSH